MWNEHGIELFPANTFVSFQRLHSLAFRHGTFAYAKDQASLSSRRFALENPTPMLLHIHLKYILKPGKGF
jgi:hypothetical protein